MRVPSTMLNRKHTAPISFPRTSRLHQVRALTSLPAGKMVPLAAIPLLREDAIQQGRFRISMEMMETAEILMNAVNVRVMAYLVPTLALERFEGSMDALNKSYRGEPRFEGGTVIPYIETHEFVGPGDCEVYDYMGLHAKPESLVNTMYLESYNQIFNHRAANRSRDITPRGRLDKDLAPAFWVHEGFRHIVPDFDQAVMEGEVALNVIESQMPVKGLGFGDSGQTTSNNFVRQTGGITEDMLNVSSGSSNLRMKVEDGFPSVFAEMQENGITVSLANIELARKTQAFARLREQYEGHTDDWLIGMLMQGLSIPDQALKQPILLADKATVFGMSKRYATDSGNLTESVVNGATFIDIGINLPRLATGGVVMLVAEVTPEQLFERQKEPFFHLSSVDQFPDALRDTLDPQKVEVVENSYVDVDHDQPDDTFGYAPLNHRWNIVAPKIGGRFLRPEVDAGFDEDRQRIWAVETQNPTLAEDFYLCTTMHTKPFVVTNQDPFEAVTVGQAVIGGLTVFGPAVVEANNNYDAVMAEAPTDRIEKDSE